MSLTWAELYQSLRETESVDYNNSKSLTWSFNLCLWWSCTRPAITITDHDAEASSTIWCCAPQKITLKNCPIIRQHHMRSQGEEGHGSPSQQQNSFFLPRGERVRLPCRGAEMAVCLVLLAASALGGTNAAFSVYLRYFVFPLLSLLSASSKLSQVLAFLHFTVTLVWPSQFLNPATADVCLLLLQLFYLSSYSFCLLFLAAFAFILCFQDPNYGGEAALCDPSRTLFLLE